jgi:hypothetical protein
MGFSIQFGFNIHGKVTELYKSNKAKNITLSNGQSKKEVVIILKNLLKVHPKYVATNCVTPFKWVNIKNIKLGDFEYLHSYDKWQYFDNNADTWIKLVFIDNSLNKIIYVWKGLKE